MSEEVQETENTNVDDTAEASTSLADVDDAATLKKMIKALRSENAAARQKKNNVETELAEYRQWKESQMTALEKANAEKEALSKKLRDTLVEKLAIEFGVDESFKEFIVGETEDDMVERARKLGTRKGSDNSDDEKIKARLLGGNRGTAVGKVMDGSNKPAGTQSEAAWFKELYENK